MKKLKDEKELLKKALVVGVKYAEARGAAKFEETDSVSVKVEYIYRLLVRDKLIQPVPEDQISQQTMKHKLALWISKQQG
jgi:predicted transcriptional regulator